MTSIAFKLGIISLIIGTIGGTPNVEDTPLEPIIFTIGDEVLLECVVKHLDNYTVLWKKIDDLSGSIETLTSDNVLITEDHRISILHEKEHGTWLLSIEPALLSDTGRYICEVNTVPPLKIYKLLTVVKSTNSPVQVLNYTECCQKNDVPPQCFGFCNLESPTFEESDGNWHCSNHLNAITKCLTDGRDHMPCCVREKIPEICRSVCRGDYQQLTVSQHYSCSNYALPTLACIAEGLELLPGPPKQLTAEVLSSTKVKLQWLPPHQSVKVTHYEINVTQVYEFNENGKLKEESEDEGIREKKELALFGQINEDSSVTTHLIHGGSRKYVIENLHPLTMYEITAVSKNEFGSSMPTSSLRTITFSRDHVPQVVANSTNITLPDVRSCCEQQGVQLGRCLRILCDPSRADETRMTDIMICAPWANVTFECMAGGFDHSPCCRERGVPEVCLDFCSGTVKRVDYRHFVCLEYMSQYGACLLDHYGVISGPPENFTLTSVHNYWALLRWDPPETLSDTVNQYNLHWRNASAFEDIEFNVIANVHSPYLLDDLKPGVRYEAYVVALNSYGTSRGSTRVVFSTAPLPDIPEEKNYTGYNETQCCFSAGLAEHCMPLCSYQMKINDLELLAPMCFDSLHILLRCGAGGRDHTPCCKERQVNPVCLPFCAGINLDSPYENVFTCEPHIADIIQCMAEGREILPDIPTNFELTTVTPTSIHVQWDRPASSNDTTFRVYYEKLKDEKTLLPDNYTNDINVTSTSVVIGKLEPDTRYSIYVVSANEHGYSLPSSILVVRTTVSGTNDTKIKATLSPPYKVEITFRTVDTLTVSWKSPLHVPPDAFLNYVVYYQLVNATSDLAHDGYFVATTFTSQVLRNLSVNTEYAVAVRARSGQGESDLSEIVMEWTDPAVPSLVHAPVVIPIGQIVEGSNVTILCIATGIPTPKVSVYVNGNLMKENKQRHVAYTIINIQRNVTNVGCYANNGYGFGKQSWQDIRVGFKPNASTAIKSVKGYEGQSIRLQCVVSGHPEPRVIWFRDAGQQQTVRSGPAIEIHSTHVVEEPYSYVFTLLLKEVRKSDEGEYYCKAENQFGTSTVSFDLRLDGHKTGSNISDCCIQKGVAEQCMGACTKGMDIEFALSRPHCMNEVNKIMVCAADGGDHQQCCRRRGVRGECTRWCRGYPVINAPMCVLIASKQVIGCFEEGKPVLPGIPQNVKSELNSDGTVYLHWEKPIKNGDFVEWYKIFWRPVGTKEVYRNQTRKTNFKIQDLKPGQTYEIFIKAGNHYGLSQSTVPTVIHIAANETSESHTAVKVAVGIVVSVLLLVLIGILIVYFKLRYRPHVEKGVSFENPTYMKESITLQNACSERPDTGNAADGIQKNTEPQRAVANIYEEPKSCNGQ